MKNSTKRKIMSRWTYWIMFEEKRIKDHQTPEKNVFFFLKNKKSSMTSACIYCACVSVTHGDDWWCWWVLIQRTRGCWSRARRQTAPRSQGKSPWVVCSRPPAPGNTPKKNRSRLFSKTMRHHRRRGMEARVGGSLRRNLITHCAAHAWHDLTHISDSQHVYMRSEAAVIAWESR